MPLGLFVNEGGYTTLAVASALLVSLSLVFGVAAVGWTVAKAADVQDVADAAALGGSDVVARYCTVAQVVDACILSMGLCGVVVLGSGLVTAAVPGAQQASEKLIQVAKQIFDARNRFARNALGALRQAEKLLPWAVVAGSWSCVQANCEGDVRYRGAALPFPTYSLSDFSALDNELDPSEAIDSAERIQEAAQRVEEAKKRADDASCRAWRADCIDDPRCMRSRAADLAGLPASQNPHVENPDSWTFGVAIRRARAYYAQRYAQEAPETDDIESVTDSCAREAYYDYALEEVRAAWYHEYEDGSVDLHIPHLACTTNEVRGTRLYTDQVWPCTQQDEGRTLHSTWSCPGATGDAAGLDSVASVESGAVCRCAHCGMDVADLGAVARISTIANNGYEHYWQIVVEEAQAFREARNEQAEAERVTRQRAQEGSDAFQKILKQFEVPRVCICPPGAWGCVSIVVRDGGVATPSELSSAFVEGTELPAGVAVSASALAPDSTEDSNVFSSLLGNVMGQNKSALGSLAGAVSRLWARVLVSYGSAYTGVGGIADSFFDGVDGVFGGSAAAWLKGKLTKLMGALGLEPADMRVRKPVLTNTAHVLGKAGIDPEGKVRHFVQAVSGGAGLAEIAQLAGVSLPADNGGDSVSVDLPRLEGVAGAPSVLELVRVEAVS